MNNISVKIVFFLALIVPALSSAEIVRVTPELLQWETIGLNIKSSKSISLKNTSNQSVEVKLSTDSPFSIALETLRIPANSNQEIDIFFTSNDTGLTSGVLEVQVIGFFDEHNTLVNLDARVSVHSLIIEPEEALDFGEIELGKKIFSMRDSYR